MISAVWISAFPAIIWTEGPRCLTLGALGRGCGELETPSTNTGSTGFGMGTVGQGPTIFRPMYSQPGRTDSRKAFLWAPSEDRAWSQGRVPMCCA